MQGGVALVAGVVVLCLVGWPAVATGALLTDVNPPAVLSGASHFLGHSVVGNESVLLHPDNNRTSVNFIDLSLKFAVEYPYDSGDVVAWQVYCARPGHARMQIWRGIDSVEFMLITETVVICDAVGLKRFELSGGEVAKFEDGDFIGWRYENDVTGEIGGPLGFAEGGVGLVLLSEWPQKNARIGDHRAFPARVRETFAVMAEFVPRTYGHVDPNVTPEIKCPDGCVHGECLDNKCVCDEGWGGIDCSRLIASPCPFVCINGYCGTDATCVCFKGWKGDDCSELLCPSNCSNHGECLPDGSCRCNVGWIGKECDTVDDIFMGEVGSIHGLTHIPTTVHFKRSYKKPVVIVGPTSFNGTEPAVVRLLNIQADKMLVRIMEPFGYDDSHMFSEDVAFLVVEEGVWELPSGTRIEVLSFETDATVGRRVPHGLFRKVDFTAPFAEIPVVLSSVQTFSENSFVYTRQNVTTRTSVRIAMEEAESSFHVHDTETIGLVALTHSHAKWGDVVFEAGQVGEPVNDQWAPFGFFKCFDHTPLLLAQIATRYFDENEHLRYSRTEMNPCEAVVHLENQPRVPCAAEWINYLAFDREGMLEAQEVGQDNEGLVEALM